jgi:hypothetical protein
VLGSPCDRQSRFQRIAGLPGVPSVAPSGRPLRGFVQAGLFKEDSMTEDGRTRHYLVVVPVGPECYRKSHRLTRYDDGITCQDCGLVASQAMVDGIDPDTAIRVFREWEPQS